MKLALLGDLHFGKSNNDDIILTGMKSFYLNQLIPYLKDNNIKDVIIAGDVFDNRTTINVKVIHTAIEVFKQLANVATINITVGNHDLYYKNTNEIDSLCIFDSIPNVTVYRTPNVIYSNIGVVPWLSEDKVDIEDLPASEICVGHFSINGFKLPKGIICDFGISYDLFKRYKKVFSGHFHTSSTATIGGTEFTYIGSPYQLNRGDKNDSRGFIIFDNETLEFERVENIKSPKFIDLNFPDKFKPALITNNFIDVNVNCLNGIYNEKILESYLEAVNKCSPANQPTINIVNSNVEEVGQVLDINTVATTKDMIIEYVNVIYDVSYNKQDLLDYILEHFQE